MLLRSRSCAPLIAVSTKKRKSRMTFCATHKHTHTHTRTIKRWRSRRAAQAKRSRFAPRSSPRRRFRRCCDRDPCGRRRRPRTAGCSTVAQRPRSEDSGRAGRGTQQRNPYMRVCVCCVRVCVCVRFVVENNTRYSNIIISKTETNDNKSQTAARKQRHAAARA